MLLAGASNAGLADPGHGTALWLAQVSARLCLLHPTLDNIVSLRIIDQMTGDLGDAFGEAHNRLAESEAALHRKVGS